MIQLSKSTYVRALKCHKSLWLNRYGKQHRRSVTRSEQARFDAGHEVGELACQLFPGGADATQSSYKDVELGVLLTRRFIEQGKSVIYEAAFIYEDVYVAVDILVRDAATGSWRAYEVKSSTGVKDVYLDDTAVQYYVLTGSGLQVSDFSIVHINNQYVRQGAIEPQGYFTLASVYDECLSRQDDVRREVAAAKAVLKARVEPSIAIGPQCSEPYECDFMPYCWKAVPAGSVFELTNLNQSRKFELYKAGHRTIRELTTAEIAGLPGKAREHAQIIQSGVTHIDKAEIQKWLRQLQYPLAYMDFETFNAAIPPYDGCRPFQQTVFQWSLHVESAPGAELSHAAYLGDGVSDPRAEFVRSLLAALPAAGSILVYNRSFEVGRLQELAAVFPDYAAQLSAIVERLVDLMIPFQAGWYQAPAFNGSYSIKAVLPALVPELSYAALAIGDGDAAMGAYTRMSTMTPADAEQTRRHLLDYCQLDTLAMVKIMAALRGL